MSPPDLCEYDGYLIAPNLEEPRLQLIRGMAEKAGLSLDFGSGSIEFQYIGRDANRWIVRFLRELATAVVDAGGEVVCKLASEDSDPTFEFYRIRDGRLLRQVGEIVRGPVEAVGICFILSRRSAVRAGDSSTRELSAYGKIITGWTADTRLKAQTAGRA